MERKDQHVEEDIDTIMQEMEAKTPRPNSNTSGNFFQFEKIQEVEEPKQADAVDAKKFNASDFFSTILKQPAKKPGHITPSRPTNERYYDYTHTNLGIALIFNQVTFKNEETRKGSEKDARDLKGVLDNIGFHTEVCPDMTTSEIRLLLQDLAQRDHSDNDCLLITVMTHGRQDGKIYSRDGEFMVNELWENFMGDNCKTLVGKPKLFFIQACRGTMTDPGTLMKQKKVEPLALSGRSDAVDSKVIKEDHYVIPSLADLLIMYSTAEGYYSFRNPTDGSWFIQALCDELRENPHEEIMTILTGVNRRVAFAKQSFVPTRREHDASKQMPVIQSMLTKSLYFLNRKQKAKMKSPGAEM